LLVLKGGGSRTGQIYPDRLLASELQSRQDKENEDAKNHINEGDNLNMNIVRILLIQADFHKNYV
jgi:hypothetical protein